MALELITPSKDIRYDQHGGAPTDCVLVCSGEPEQRFHVHKELFSFCPFTFLNYMYFLCSLSLE